MLYQKIKPSYDRKNNVWRIDFYNNRKRYQHSFKSKIKAERKAQEYNDDFSIDVDLTDKEKEDALQALRLLKSKDFKDYKLVFISEWFIKNYKMIESSMSLSDAVEEYLGRKCSFYGKTAPSYKNTYQFLKDIKHSSIADSKISTITVKELQEYADSFVASYLQRRQYLVELFNYLCGKSQDFKIQTPYISDNIAQRLNKPPRKAIPKIHILNSNEVSRIIEESIKRECVHAFIWLLYTGMRPSFKSKSEGGEFAKFWANPDYGWKLIHFSESDENDKEEKIIVPVEVSKTSRYREIPISKNLKKWLILFKSDPKKYSFPPKNWKRKFSWVKKTVLGKGEKYYTNDITRHTFISYAIPLMNNYIELTLITGNSEKKIKDNYASLINIHDPKQKENYDKFWSLVPEDFTL